MELRRFAVTVENPVPASGTGRGWSVERCDLSGAAVLETDGQVCLDKAAARELAGLLLAYAEETPGPNG